MSAGKAAILIVAGGALLVVALDPSIFSGMGGVYTGLKAAVGALTGQTANQAAADVTSPAQVLKNLAEVIGKNGLTGASQGHTGMSGAGNAPAPTSNAPDCQQVKQTCSASYSQDDPQWLVCVTGAPGNPCYPAQTGSGGPFAGYFGVHPAGAGSVIYHA